jgi:hypothetical protein
MAIFDVAQINEQGVDLVLVPLHANFEFRSEQEKTAIVARLRSGASGVGLDGVVIPVWALRSGKMGYFVPDRFRALLRGLDLEFVADNINGEINVSDRTSTLMDALSEETCVSAQQARADP